MVDLVDWACRGEAGDTGIKDWEAYLDHLLRPYVQKTNTPIIKKPPESSVTPKTINNMVIKYQIGSKQKIQQKQISYYKIITTPNPKLRRTSWSTTLLPITDTPSDYKDMTIPNPVLISSPFAPIKKNVFSEK